MEANEKVKNKEIDIKKINSALETLKGNIRQHQKWTDPIDLT